MTDRTLEDRTRWYILKNAIFIVLESMLASGHGLFVPETNGHIILSSIYMIIGRFIYCYIVGEQLRAIFNVFST